MAPAIAAESGHDAERGGGQEAGDGGAAAAWDGAQGAAQLTRLRASEHDVERPRWGVDAEAGTTISGLRNVCSSPAVTCLLVVTPKGGAATFASLGVSHAQRRPVPLLASLIGTSRTRPAVLGVAAIAALGAALALLVQPLGCVQNSHYAEVRSIARGDPTIDRYQWQTCDKSYVDGHFYAARPPGLAFAALPLYVVLHAAGLAWDRLPAVQSFQAGAYVPRTAIYPFTLWAVLLPVLGLLLIVRRLADEVAPGTGAATAVCLGLATLLLPYSTLFFTHGLATLLEGGALYLLWRERHGHRGDLRLVGLSGLLIGLAIVVEHPVGVVAIALGIYALLTRPIVKRAAAYTVGAVVGISPLLAFDQWAFGSPTRLAYTHVVTNAGQTGHDVVGRQDFGFFGITAPHPGTMLALLFTRKGFLIETPVVAAAVAGLVLLYRRGLRAEALLVGLTSLAILTYDSAYYQPFGGDGAGMRFLIPSLPLLVLPLAAAFRRWPAPTIALAAVSALSMLGAVTTNPMLGDDHTGVWYRDALHGRFTGTLLSLAGAGRGWLSLLPFLALVLVAVGLAAAASPLRRPSQAEVAAALLAVAAWASAAAAGPRLLAPGAGVAGEVAILLLAVALAVLLALGARRPYLALSAALPLVALAVPDVRSSAAGVLLVAVVTLGAGWLAAGIPWAQPPARA